MDIFAFLLLYSILFICIGTLVMHCDKKKYGRDDSFYYGYSSKRRIVQKRMVLDQISEVFETFFIALIILIIGAAIGALDDLRKYWNGTGEYVDQFVKIMFDIYVPLIGALLAFASFVKKTWLTFTADDIVNRFGVKKLQ